MLDVECRGRGEVGRDDFRLLIQAQGPLRVTLNRETGYKGFQLLLHV